MILLKATNEAIELVTSSTAGIDFSVSFVDITTTTFTPSTTEGKITTATTTTITAAPAASTQRQIKLITIRNIHASTSNTICVQKDTAGTKYKLTTEVILLTGEVLQYMDGVGWIYYAATGAVKSAAADLTGHITSSGAATLLGSFTSAHLSGALTDETGTGVAVFNNTPTLIAPLLGTPTSGALTNCTLIPAAQLSGATLASGVTASSLTSFGASIALGTPASGTLTSCTGLPIGSGVSGLGTGVATFLATPSSANLLAAVTDETGTGVLTFATAPTFTTNITVPLVIGGTSTTQTLIYRTTSGVGATGARHIFQVGNNGATEAMTILNNGRVGIGQAAPAFPLDVNGTIASNINDGEIRSYQTKDDFWISLRTAAPKSGIFRSNTDFLLYYDTNTGDTNMDATFSGSSNIFRIQGTERMRVDNGGRVGIGISSPAASALLDLTSTARALLITRLTTTQRDAMTAVNGMIIYNSTDAKFQGREAGAWVNLI